MEATRNSQGEKKNPSLIGGSPGGWNGDVELNSITEPVRIGQEMWLLSLCQLTR